MPPFPVAKPGSRRSSGPAHAGSRQPQRPEARSLVGELSLTSPQFRQWWADRHVAHPEFGTKTIRHPELGDLTLDWDTFEYSGDPDQKLMVWSAEPGSSTHDKLRILSSLTAPNVARDASPHGR